MSEHEPDAPHPDLDPRVIKTTARHLRVVWTRDVIIIALLIFALILLLRQSSDTSKTTDLIRQTQIQNTQKTDTSLKILQLFKDCTIEGGKCFEEQRKNQSNIITLLSQGTLGIIVAALSCQEDGITEQKALARCTIGRSQPE